MQQCAKFEHRDQRNVGVTSAHIHPSSKHIMMKEVDVCSFRVKAQKEGNLSACDEHLG